MKNNENINNKMQDILNKIINSRINNLLEIININYPDKFEKKYISKEFNYIKEHIKWKQQNKISVNEEIKEKKQKKYKKHIQLKDKVKKKIRVKLKYKSTKIVEINKKEITLDNDINDDIDYIDDDIDNDINRCSGRIWSEYIFNSKTMVKLNEIDDKFKVDDFIDIDIKDFTSKYIIGKRCSKNKSNNENLDSKYCKLHSKHLIHGDYLESPTKELCFHFMKDGKYL